MFHLFENQKNVSKMTRFRYLYLQELKPVLMHWSRDLM